MGFTSTRPRATTRTPESRYPVLYLLHGNGNTEATWSVFGRAHLIADNLLAQGQAQPLIIVMPDGYAAPLSMSVSSAAAAAAAERGRNSAAFERDLLEDILPFVAANYRVRDEASSRALVGLAIGGAQSLTIGLNHAERFAWVGSFSAVPFDPATALAAALADPKATDSALRLVWIACGKKRPPRRERPAVIGGVEGQRDPPRAAYDGGRPSLVALSSLPGGDPPPPVRHQTLILPPDVPQGTVRVANRAGVA